jgi:hypothetical protein
MKSIALRSEYQVMKTEPRTAVKGFQATKKPRKNFRGLVKTWD